MKSRAIRLLHITNDSNSIACITGQFQYMKNRDIQVYVMASSGRRLEVFGESEGIFVKAVKMSGKIAPLYSLVLLYRMWRYIRSIRPHIVDAHTNRSGFIGIIAARLARVPVRIYHIHGLAFLNAEGFRRVILTWSERLACLFATQVLCVSDSVCGTAIVNGLCSCDKIKVLCSGSINGVDADEKFNPNRFSQNGRMETRAELGIPNNSRVIGFVDRIVRHKGIIELVEAWMSLREEFPDLHLVVVGSIEAEEPLPAEVTRYLKSDERIYLLGLQVDTPRIYTAMDMVVLPAHREGFPAALMEASSMGLPVVATQVPGCTDAVQDGVTGTLVTSKDPFALANAVRSYLNDNELAKRHGRRGRGRMLREFRQADIWEALYQEYERLLRIAGVSRECFDNDASEVQYNHAYI